jgi:hypothetical protein
MLMGRTGSYWDIIDNYDSPYLYILDDFNANVLWINSAYADELKHLCIINSLILADCVNLPVDNYICVSNAHDSMSGFDQQITKM